MALHYVDDHEPGITRRRRGRYWQYFDTDGKRITDREKIDRLNAVGLPPAYRNAWFCPDPEGHLQAVGWDAKGRKQYRYHAGFRARRDARKFERLAEFGRALPRLRRRVARDLEAKATSEVAVIAAVVRLIDATNMRVGSEEYARANKSFGATTLRERHARITGDKVKLRFPGKHGIPCEEVVNDKRLARIARRTQELPGQHLFAIVGEDGGVRPVNSADVNGYIQAAMGEDFTAKNFRTWGASVIAFAAMAKRARQEKDISIKAMVAPVAEALGNTPAISRKSYVHPALIEAVKAGDGMACGEAPATPKRHLSVAEQGLIGFLDGLGRKGKKSVRRGS
ncbi:MAG: DNA topoisomerase IB [Sphingosinicella sp.]